MLVKQTFKSISCETFRVLKNEKNIDVHLFVTVITI